MKTSERKPPFNDAVERTSKTADDERRQKGLLVPLG